MLAKTRDSNALVQVLEPTLGKMIAQIVVGENIKECNEDVKESIVQKEFLTSLFVNIFQNYYHQAELIKEKDAFIGRVLQTLDQTTDEKEVLVLFMPNRSPHAVLQKYFQLLHGPIIGPKLFTIKCGEFHLKDLNQLDQSAIPAMVFAILQSTATTPTTVAQFRSRLVQTLEEIYGKERGEQMSAYVTDLESRIGSFLQMLVGNAIRDILLAVELGKHKVKELYLLPVTKQLDISFKIVNKILGEELTPGRKKEIKQRLIQFIDADIDLCPAPGKTTKEQIVAREELEKEFEQDKQKAEGHAILHITELMESHPQFIDHMHVSDFIREFNGKLPKDVRSRLGVFIENTSGPSELKELLFEGQSRSMHHADDKRVTDFFAQHFGDMRARRIVGDLKKKIDIGEFKVADTEKRKRFMDKAMQTYFGQVSLQKKAMIEDGLSQLLQCKEN